MWIGVTVFFLPLDASFCTTFGLVGCMDFRHLILFQFHSHSFLSIHKSKWEPTNKPPTVIWCSERTQNHALINFVLVLFGFQFSVFNCTATPWRIPLPQHSFSEMSLFFISKYLFSIFITGNIFIHVCCPFKRFLSLEIFNFNYFFSLNFWIE